MKYQVLNFKKEVVGEIDLPEKVFKFKWSPVLVKQVLLAQMANLRAPWAHAKDRSEVRGGGRKPWRQKGTGRARHGSSRSPLWIGGGKAHGPNKNRDYSQKVNKKMRRAAIFSVLSRKLKENEVVFLDKIDFEPAKTKAVAENLKNFLGLSKKSKKYDVLMIPDSENKKISQIAKNLPKTKVVLPDSLNIQDLLSYKNIFIDKKAVDLISKHYKI